MALGHAQRCSGDVQLLARLFEIEHTAIAVIKAGGKISIQFALEYGAQSMRLELRPAIGEGAGIDIGKNIAVRRGELSYAE
jgi:hypothetical protein